MISGRPRSIPPAPKVPKLTRSLRWAGPRICPATVRFRRGRLSSGPYSGNCPDLEYCCPSGAAAGGSGGEAVFEIRVVRRIRSGIPAAKPEIQTALGRAYSGPRLFGALISVNFTAPTNPLPSVPSSSNSSNRNVMLLTNIVLSAFTSCSSLALIPIRRPGPGPGTSSTGSVKRFRPRLRLVVTPCVETCKIAIQKKI